MEFSAKKPKKVFRQKKAKDGVWSFPSKKPKKVFYFEHVKILTVK